MLSVFQRNLTTAIVHPIQSFNSGITHSMYYSDSNSIEKHPEEDISIVETLDNKEDHPDNIRSIMCANPRKKLYFNPDYFELELLMVIQSYENIIRTNAIAKIKNIIYIFFFFRLLRPQH